MEKEAESERGGTPSRSEDSDVAPDTHRTETDIEVGKPDGEQAQPGKQHVPPIERARALVTHGAQRGFGHLVAHASCEVTEGVAAERVASEKNDIGREDQRAEPDAEADAP